jgi:predicted component of type VI protein secretion system
MGLPLSRPERVDTVEVLAYGYRRRSTLVDLRVVGATWAWSVIP